MTSALNLLPRPTCHKTSPSSAICYKLIQMATTYFNEPLESAELAAFAQIVASKSVSRAARELGVPRATLGRRLARLEERLGVRLLRRTTRTSALTDAGVAFHRHALIALEAVGRAEESVRRVNDAVRGPLRVAVPPMSDPTFFALACDFARRFPDVVLELHFSTRLVDLHRDGFDIAIRASTDLEPGLVARTLARAPMVAVASPAYLEARGTPRRASDLRRHRCLLGFARGEIPQSTWPLLSGKKVKVEGAMLSNEINLLHEAAVRGLGVALLPLNLVGASLAAGELLHVLAGVVGAEAKISIVYPEREFLPPQVRAFADTVVEWMARDPLSAGRRPARIKG